MRERTMVYLERRQLDALRKEAQAMGVSLAELVRRLVEVHLKARPREPRPPRQAYLKIVGLGHSGRRDVSEHHDAYLGEAIVRDDPR